MADHLCPWWVGYLLACPIRKLMQSPRKILAGHIRSGSTVLDVGCAMGFFTLEMARMVGEEGQVFAVDLQPRMLTSLKRRATRAGLDRRITPRQCSEKSLEIGDLSGQIDFALVMAVVHEVPDASHLMQELFNVVKPHGRLLLAEPSGHVKSAQYEESEMAAVAAGFEIIDHPTIRRSHASLLQRQAR